MIPKLSIGQLIKERQELVGAAVRVHGDTADTRLIVYRTVERIVALTLGRVCWDEVYQRMLEDGGEHSTWEWCERLEMEALQFAVEVGKLRIVGLVRTRFATAGAMSMAVPWSDHTDDLAKGGAE